MSGDMQAIIILNNDNNQAHFHLQLLFITVPLGLDSCKLIYIVSDYYASTNPNTGAEVQQQQITQVVRGRELQK